MSKSKVLHQHLKSKERNKIQEFLPSDKGLAETEKNDIASEDKTSSDPNIFLLNNLLMSVQFFENYDRDIKLLRANWFKEVSIESHHKKCFYADSLFKLVGVKAKFSKRHGKHKNIETSLHPLRIYISSDNVNAAYDPSELGRGGNNNNTNNVWPQYQFTVRTNDDTEESGCISLVEFKTLEAPSKSPTTKKPRNNFTFNEALNLNEKTEENSAFLQRKSNFDQKFGRRLTKTEKLIASQNKELQLKIFEKRCSIKYSSTPGNGFYKFTSPEVITKPKNIQVFRMNFSPTSSHEIPPLCFQKEEVKNKINSRRNGFNACFKTYKLLHSTAYKSYFCDLLIEQLFKPLGLDLNSVNQSSVLKEFIILNDKGVQNYITPVIWIRDWNNFIDINKKACIRKTTLKWPTDYMQDITKVLPCYAVPTGHLDTTEKYLDNETMWKLVFPKAEEFLILHIMHAQVRCYIFVMLIYKSFIETEINSASFGPEHLIHFFFWRVHRNFLAWPEDRPGETLLKYLKILYKKIQSKTLHDFFITSKNLFASSHSKDLHKTQVLIKKIIENPVPYVMSAIRNLKFESNFYPALDILKLKTILTAKNEPEKSKKNLKKEKKQNKVHFQDQEVQWIKKAIRQIELEKNIDKQEKSRQLSVESINVADMLDLNWQNSEKFNQILEIFAFHFINMAGHSIEYKFLSQAFFYLDQSQKLLRLMVADGIKRDSLIQAKEKISKLKKTCLNIFKPTLNQSLKQEKLFQVSSKTLENFVSQKKEKSQNSVTDETKKEIFPSDFENIKENSIITIKL